MATTTFNIVDTQGLVQDFWSPFLDKQLRQANLWTGLFQDPNYTVSSTAGGDTHKITRVNKSSSTIKTIGTDADSFTSNVLSTTQLELAITKRCVSSYKFQDLAVVMSQLEDADSEIRSSLLADVMEQANTWIKTLVSPSTSSPDHVITSVTDFNLAQLSAITLLANQAKWKSSGQPYLLLADPVYYQDMIDDTTLSSASALGIGKSPIIDGFFELKRMGWNIAMDDSLSTDTAYGMLANALKVIIGEPRFLISDLHANEQFGYIMSVDFVLGGLQMDSERTITIED